MQYCAYQQSDQQPLFDKDPGKFNFSAQTSGPRKLLGFLKEVNTFFVQNGANFAIEMNVTYPDVAAAASVPRPCPVCESNGVQQRPESPV